MKMHDKLGRALGVLHIGINGADFDIKPTCGDNRQFRRILMDQNAKKDKSLLFDKFEDFVTKLIIRDNTDIPEEDAKMFVEFNVNALFDEFMVGFGWTTRAELEKSKQQALGKLTGED